MTTDSTASTAAAGTVRRRPRPRLIGVMSQRSAGRRARPNGEHDVFEGLCTLVIMRGAAVVGVGLALIMAACGDGAPRVFRDRAELTSCGEAEFGLVVSAAPVPQSLGCFQRAYESGDLAEVAITSRSIEGDVQRVWARSLGDGQAEMFVTHSDWDGTGTTWTRFECSSLEFGSDGVPAYGLGRCSVDPLK